MVLADLYKKYKDLAICLVLGVGLLILLNSSPLGVHRTSAQVDPLPLESSYDTIDGVDANDIFIQGNNAYLVTKNNTGGTPPDPELFVFDISSPQKPVKLGSIALETSINKIFVAGDFAYLATTNDSKELIIVNVANPSNLYQAGSYNISGAYNSLSIFVVNTTVYLGNARGIHILNAANPAAPVLLGLYNIGARINDIFVENGYAYLATTKNYKEFLLLNVSNPSAIREVSGLDLVGSAGATGIAKKGTKAYITANNGNSNPDFFAVNIANPTNPVLLGSINLGSNNTAVRVFRDRAYVTTETSSTALSIIDVRNSTLTRVATYNAGSAVGGLSLKPPFVFLATSNEQRELQIVNASSFLRPNIVYIMTDDQRWDTLSYMPNLQNLLVSAGINFTNAFVSTPLCCPTRASNLTGQYAHNAGVLTNSPPLGGALKFVGKDSSTIATWLKNKGYKTGFYGKYMNGYLYQCPPSTSSCYVPPGWEEWHALVQQASFNYELTEGSLTTKYGSSTADYSTDVITTRAIDFINSSLEKPFFLFINYHHPHAEGLLLPQPAPRHDGMFSAVESWRPASYDEEDYSDKPQFIPNVNKRASTQLSPYVTYGAWTDMFRQKQIESLQAIDESIALIVNQLQLSGELEDTVIIYTSDNGFGWGEHRFFFEKGCAYEECLRVPLIIAYPRLVPQSRVDSRFALVIDVAPTLAELAGTTPGNAVNGMSLVPILKQSPSITWRSDFLFEYWTSSTVPFYRGVRTSNWKYVEYPENSFEELYDLVNDPYELQNVAPDPQHASLKTDLKARTQLLFSQ